MIKRTALRAFFPGLLAIGAVALGVASAAGEDRSQARSEGNRIAFQTAALVATR